MPVYTSVPSSPLFSLELPHAAGSICDVAWEPGGNALAAVSSTGWVFIWETSTGVLLRQKQVARTPLLSIAWARQERCLAVGCRNGILRMLDAYLSVCATYPFSTPVTRIAWSPHVLGACLIVTGTRVTLIREERLTPCVLQYQSAVLDAAWSGDGRQVAILCADGLLEIWQARTRQLVQRFATEPVAAGSLLWDQACCTIAVAQHTGSLQLYALPQQAPSRSSGHITLPPMSLGIQRAVQDPSGRYLAATSSQAVHLYAVLSPTHAHLQTSAFQSPGEESPY